MPPTAETPPGPPVHVLFVCLGNICRSPMAEGVFRHQVREAGLEETIVIDSAGCGPWHIGSPPDQRAQAAARRRGYDISRQRGRQADLEDLQHYDFVLAMDRSNLKRLQALGPGRAELRLFCEFATGTDADEVPDPYYGGGEGFEYALDLIENAGQGLLAHIRTTRLGG